MISKNWMIAIGAVIALFALAALTREGPKQRATPAPVAEGATSAYTQESYPDLFKAWGADGVARIERARAGGAKVAARDPKCDRVDAVDIAQQQSHPPDLIILFAICANWYKIDRITEDQALAAGG